MIKTVKLLVIVIIVFKRYHVTYVWYYLCTRWVEMVYTDRLNYSFLLTCFTRMVSLWN